MCLGVPGKLVKKWHKGNSQFGKIDFGGVIKEVCLDFIPEIELGEYAIIHVGFGISRIDEEEAQKTMQLLHELDMIADELPELANSSNEK